MTTATSSASNIKDFDGVRKGWDGARNSTPID